MIFGDIMVHIGHKITNLLNEIHAGRYIRKNELLRRSARLPDLTPPDFLVVSCFNKDYVCIAEIRKALKRYLYCFII